MTRAMLLIITPVAPAVARQSEGNENLRWLPFLDQQWMRYKREQWLPKRPLFDRLARQGELDGNHYELLTPAAEALEQRHPLAATLMLRSMIDFSLIHARSKRYGHAARHLQTCEHLAKRIEDFGDRRDHAAYFAHVRHLHGRKSAF